VADKRPEGDADPDPAEAWSKQDGSVGRAGQPPSDDPLSADSRAPGEVLAENGAARTLGQHPAGDRAVREVLALHHVRGMTARSVEKPNVQSQRGEVMACPDGVHRLEK
jgi:hypothetical protein